MSRDDVLSTSDQLAEACLQSELKPGVQSIQSNKLWWLPILWRAQTAAMTHGKSAAAKLPWSKAWGPSSPSVCAQWLAVVYSGHQRSVWVLLQRFCVFVTLMKKFYWTLCISVCPSFLIRQRDRHGDAGSLTQSPSHISSASQPQRTTALPAGRPQHHCLHLRPSMTVTLWSASAAFKSFK